MYKDITLGGSGCKPTIINGSNIALRAADFILPDRVLTVESGADQTQISSCQQQENIPHSVNQTIISPSAFIEHQKRHY